MMKSIIAVFFKSGLFIPTILLLLCLTTKAYFKVEDEAVCAGIRWFGLVNQPTFTVRTEDAKDVTVERKWIGKKRAWQFGLVMLKDGSKLNFAEDPFLNTSLRRQRRLWYNLTSQVAKLSLY